MKIDNQTHWRTDQIRRLVQRVAEAELDPERRRGFLVEVTYNRQRGRGGGCSGWAPYHGRMIRIMLPSDTVDTVDLAHCIAHEIGHSRGLHHRQMNTRRYDRGVEGWRDYYAWASDYLIERKVPRHRPKLTLMDRVTSKLVHAQVQLRRWETKVKRASTGARKWRRKVSYYRRQQALAAVRAPEPRPKEEPR